jgi:hypothetical protein
MAFVPQVPPSQGTSPRARDLAQRLKQEIDTFTRQHPGTSPADIRQAGELVTGRAGGSRTAARRAVASLLGGLLVAGGLAVFLAARQGGDGLPDFQVPAVAIAVAIGLVALVFVIRRRE